MVSLDPNNEILISVVIPVKNGDAWLEDTIPALLRQQLPGPFEIIVIDSGSTDRTLRILEKYPVEIHRIPPGEFDHGATRNLGVSLARGRYVAMTVQDAQPENEHWLQCLLDGFDNENVAAVCGQQIVDHDLRKNPIDWFRPVSLPDMKKYCFNPPDVFNRLSPEEQRSICRWDNVNAMYKRDILLKLPFRTTAFAEDALWAKDALLAGYAIVYNTAARVIHYHVETPDYAFRRTFTVAYHFFRYFDVRPAAIDNGPVRMLRNLKVLLKERKIGWGDKWKWLWFNYRYRKAVNASIADFHAALAKGQPELDRKHAEICKTPPQALKPAGKDPE